jgi:drug/metabolite transporter (DMT)-like permease
MAELNVQPKSKSPWWIWLIVAAIVLGILFFFLNGNNDNESVSPDNNRDTTGVTGMTITDHNWYYLT